jgi:hypothetical protein
VAVIYFALRFKANIGFISAPFGCTSTLLNTNQETRGSNRARSTEKPCDEDSYCESDSDNEISRALFLPRRRRPILSRLVRLPAVRFKDSLRARHLGERFWQAKSSLNPDNGPIWLVLLAHFIRRNQLSSSSQN